MPGRSKLLPVPYFVQPTDNTCQSSCLKMMATYLEQSVVLQSTGAAALSIHPQIWEEINTGTKRPVQQRNNHKNMQWWLQTHFPMLTFDYREAIREARALQEIVTFIDGDFPVIVAVSHANVDGHIILVVGYENWEPNMASPDFKLVVHDPYGRLDPSLKSSLFGWRRWQGGTSLAGSGGGEQGPGMNVRLPIVAASRQQLPMEAWSREIDSTFNKPGSPVEHLQQAERAWRGAEEQLGLYYLISGHR